MTTYRFLGGSLDGQTFDITNAYVGMPWHSQYQSGKQTELYTLNADDCFHFERYGLGPVGRPDRSAYDADMKPVCQKLSAILNELDAVLQKHGGPDHTQYHIGNWLIRHEDS